MLRRPLDGQERAFKVAQLAEAARTVDGRSVFANVVAAAVVVLRVKQAVAVGARGSFFVQAVVGAAGVVHVDVGGGEVKAAGEEQRRCE